MACNAFAERRNIQIGDDFTIEYKGIRITKKVKGMIESAEYEFRQADGDADIYLENIAIAYLSYYALDSLNLSFTVPYTQLVIRTKDNGGLAHEEAVAEKLNHKYSTMIDRKSVQGLARLDSELDQHQMFSYVFIVIFVGIAILVIVTTMGRHGRKTADADWHDECTWIKKMENIISLYELQPCGDTGRNGFGNNYRDRVAVSGTGQYVCRLVYCAGTARRFSRRIHLYSGACDCSLPVVVLCGKQEAFKGKTGRGTASGSAKAGKTLYF